MRKRNEQFDKVGSEQDTSHFSRTDWAKPDPGIGVRGERGQGTTFVGTEGGELVVPSPSPKIRIQYQFEAFCKKVINGERCDYLRELLRRSEWESSFSDIPTTVLDRLYTLDDDPAEQYIFYVHGHPIPIRNDRLAESLLAFGTEGYSILLLAYSLELSDREIGELLGLSRSKIQRDRQRLFAELKKEMKG